MILEQATAGFWLRTFGLTIPDASPSYVWLLFILQIPSSISPPKVMLSQSLYLNYSIITLVTWIIWNYLMNLFMSSLFLEYKFL